MNIKKCGFLSLGSSCFFSCVLQTLEGLGGKVGSGCEEVENRRWYTGFMFLRVLVPADPRCRRKRAVILNGCCFFSVTLSLILMKTGTHAI